MILKCFLKFFLVILLLSFISSNSSGEERSSFKQALPGYEYSFPRDFFSHDDFKVEWWYYTGNLEGEDGLQFGYQLTFFRVDLDGTNTIPNPSRWKIKQIYFAHMTVTDIDNKKFYFFERINRNALNSAGARSDRFLVWNEDWVLTKRGKSHHLKAVQSGTGIDLLLKPLKKLVFHGENGVSQKGTGEGNASHYFSYTRMMSEGTVWIGGKPFTVKGTSWMDREFSSNHLSREHVGWDWFSLKLDNQIEIMLYQIRLKKGGVEPYSSGTLIAEDGSSQKLKLSKFKIKQTDRWISKNTGIRYPSKWIISISERNIQLEISPNLADQELHHLRSIAGSYWEGSVNIQGHYKGRPVTGTGYIELVGYGKPLKTELEQDQQSH
tara:strand:- start:3228 stop:4367 length:1140 start_codon:yes stop_codon:yes gene_type:complete